MGSAVYVSGAQIYFEWVLNGNLLIALSFFAIACYRYRRSEKASLFRTRFSWI